MAALQLSETQVSDAKKNPKGGWNVRKKKKNSFWDTPAWYRNHLHSNGAFKKHDSNVSDNLFSKTSTDKDPERKEVLRIVKRHLAAWWQGQTLHTVTSKAKLNHHLHKSLGISFYYLPE